jgi:type II secretory pathway pseudopilin PulG
VNDDVPARYRFPSSARSTTALMVLLSAIVGIVAVVAVVLAILAGGRVSDNVARIQNVVQANRSLITRLQQVQLQACRRSDRSDRILRGLLIVDVGFIQHSRAVDPAQRRLLAKTFERAAAELQPRCPAPTKGNP